MVSLRRYCFFGGFLKISFLEFEVSSGTSALGLSGIIRLCVIKFLEGR